MQRFESVRLHLARLHQAILWVAVPIGLLLGFDPHALCRLGGLYARVAYLAQSSAGRPRIALAVENSVCRIVAVVDADTHAGRDGYFVQVVRQIRVDLVVERERDVPPDTMPVDAICETPVYAHTTFQRVRPNRPDLYLVASLLKPANRPDGTVCASQRRIHQQIDATLCAFTTQTTYEATRICVCFL